MSDLRTGEPHFRRLIDAFAAFYALPSFMYRGQVYSPGVLLEALILTESSGNPEARRYEPHQDRAGRKDAASDADRPGQDDGAKEDDSSYGLTQVMGYNWRRIVGAAPGTSLNFASFAFDPGFSISAGIRILRDEISSLYRENPHQSEHERLVRALARYNGGPTGDDPTGPNGDIRLRGYVDKVATNAHKAYLDRKLVSWEEMTRW